MQGRTAVSSHDNYVVSKGKQPNMVMLEVVHMHLSRFRIGQNLGFRQSFADSKPLADLDEMVRHEAASCGDIVDRRSVSTHLKYFRLIEVIQDLPCLWCFNFPDRVLRAGQWIFHGLQFALGGSLAHEKASKSCKRNCYH